MKTISSELRTHLAQQYQTMCTCWLCVRQDAVVFAATDHDRDLVFDLETAMGALGLDPPAWVVGTGSRTYQAATGFTASNIASGIGLNVDNGKAHGVLSSPAITEADLRAGLWDDANIIIFQVNWADLAVGPLIQRVGAVGEVTTERTHFKAEWRGLMQRYQATLGELTSPFCQAILGDSRCGKSLTSFTVTGTIDAVSADGLTIIDAARAEAGPATALTISSITNANPGVVTVNDATDLINGQPVMLSGSVATALQGITFVRGLSGNSFNIGIDTSDTAVYTPYVSGGKVTPLGSGSGYFDNGQITFTSGANNGISIEVRAYVVGQWTLQLPPPYQLAAGVTYSMVAGCDKSLNTCRDRFNNVVNFRGFPYLPGVDSIVQVGRHNG